VEICGLDQRLFENLTAAIRALRRLFQNVIRDAGIGTGNTIEDVIEGDLCAFVIAAFTRVNQLLGFVQSSDVA